MDDHQRGGVFVCVCVFVYVCVSMCLCFQSSWTSVVSNPPVVCVIKKQPTVGRMNWF